MIVIVRKKRKKIRKKINNLFYNIFFYHNKLYKYQTNILLFTFLLLIYLFFHNIFYNYHLNTYLLIEKLFWIIK